MQAEASFLIEVETPMTDAVLARVSPGYPPPQGRLPTCYSPVRRSPVAEATFAHDLHVLSTPPAFILSQDQTLQFRSYSPQPTESALAMISEFTLTSPKRVELKKNRSLTFPLFSFQRTGARPSTGAKSNRMSQRIPCQGLRD
jgi:hypothetical protein